MDDYISRRTAINRLWKALYDYEDKTEKQFQESDELDIEDWFEHRIFVQNMNDIDRQTILEMPSADIQEELENAYMHGYTAAEARYRDTLRHGYWIESDTDGFVCSVCRNGYRNQPTLMGKPMFEYCPVCGARMDGEQNE